MRNTTLLAFGSTIALIALILMPVLATPPGIKSSGNNNPNKLWGAPTYLINILGKKSDFSGDPSYESTDRRTMFVPENVSDFLAIKNLTDCKIWVQQGINFSVLDPNMFDDGQCGLQIGPGKYEVYFVGLGKPGSTAFIEGWIYNASANEYLLNIGNVTVKHNKRPDWQSGYNIFHVSQAEASGLGLNWTQVLVDLGLPLDSTEIWVFDFINWLAAQTGYEYLYLWKLVSGCKHIQVRFYKVD